MADKQDVEVAAEELKRQLEALADRRIDATPAQLVRSWWYPVSATSYDLPSDPSEIFWKNPILPGPRCTAGRLLDISGANSTGTDGQRMFLLSDFLCGGGSGYALRDPINVVATARSSAPCFLTLTYDLITRGEITDVQFDAFTWNADGSAAPNVLFDWRCRVMADEVIQ